MAQPFIAEIRIFSGTYAPKGWAMCNGQLLSIAQNQALFSLLGTTYGGDGRTTFALPDLKQRFPLNYGEGGGLSKRAIGESGGAASHTLTVGELPRHSHNLAASTSDGVAVAPTGALLAKPTTPQPPYHDPNALALMPPGSLGLSGSGGAHNNLQPYLVLNFAIALEGIYPSQS